jgi:hypothetical protein
MRENLILAASSFPAEAGPTKLVAEKVKSAPDVESLSYGNGFKGLVRIRIARSQFQRLLPIKGRVQPAHRAVTVQGKQLQGPQCASTPIRHQHQPVTPARGSLTCARAAR